MVLHYNPPSSIKRVGVMTKQMTRKWSSFLSTCVDIYPFSNLHLIWSISPWDWYWKSDYHCLILKQCIVSIENFIAELVPDMYFNLGSVLLSASMNSSELHLLTQAIPVPIEYVYPARDRTPTDYPLKWSGYLLTLGQILHSQFPMVNPEDWHEMMSVGLYV